MSIVVAAEAKARGRARVVVAAALPVTMSYCCHKIVPVAERGIPQQAFAIARE